MLLRKQKLTVSTSMVGRILTRLKQSGQLPEPLRLAVPGSRRSLRPRPYAIRKPKQYAVSRSGDLVQVDTLDVRPVPGVVFQQFTARDVVSRRDLIQAHGRATAYAASQFLETLLHRMPFPIRVPCRSMADRSSPPSSSRPASSARTAPVRVASSLPQTQRRAGTCQPYSHPGVLPGQPLLPGNEQAPS